MRKLCVLLVCLLMLTGCAGAPVFEQLGDVYNPSQAPEPKKVSLTLPNDAASPVISGAAGKLYFCDGYEIMVETLASGDLSATVKALTGYSRDALTLLETHLGETKRYECVWTAAGEVGDRVGRAVILDDGSYHYCVSVMADAVDAGALQESWEELFSSFVLG